MVILKSRENLLCIPHTIQGFMFLSVLSWVIFPPFFWIITSKERPDEVFALMSKESFARGSLSLRHWSQTFRNTVTNSRNHSMRNTPRQPVGFYTIRLLMYRLEWDHDALPNPCKSASRPNKNKWLNKKSVLALKLIFITAVCQRNPMKTCFAVFSGADCNLAPLQGRWL